MTREVWVWCALAIAALVWCGLATASGGGLLIPVLFAGLCAICATDGPARGRVTRLIGKAFSGPAWRSALILAGALMLIQLLPVELALLMAGDVLAYVEAVAAVSLIAANTRLRPLVRAMGARGRIFVSRLRSCAKTIRQGRTRSPRRGKPPSDDPGGPAWAFA